MVTQARRAGRPGERMAIPGVAAMVSGLPNDASVEDQVNEHQNDRRYAENPGEQILSHDAIPVK